MSVKNGKETEVNGEAEKNTEKEEEEDPEEEDEESLADDLSDQSDREVDEEKETAIDYKVLGNEKFSELPSLRVTSTWVNQATNFSAVVNDSSTKDVDLIELPDSLKLQRPNLIQKWFPVQHAVLPSLLKEARIPPLLRPRDIAIAAPTGSGKTLCYVLPILANQQKVVSNALYALIIVPVQTLVRQIEEEFSRWNPSGAVKVLNLSGVHDYDSESRRLDSLKPNVIVATPARFVQHLTAVPSFIDLSRLRYLVVDEADRMGSLVREEWLDVIEKFSECNSSSANMSDVFKNRQAPQKIVLSATLSKDVEDLHLWNLYRPRLFSATSSSSKENTNSVNHMSGVLALPGSIQHKILVCTAKFHPLAVYHHLCERKWNRVLIFVNEIESSNRLASVLKHLCKDKYEVDFFTAELFGKRRQKLFQRFKTGENRVLIASDVLARGVDVEDIDCVINYNLPQYDKLFVHRSGRTGRAGRSGFVLSIADNETKRIFIKMLKKTDLYGESTEEVAEENDFQQYMNAYQTALDELKATVAVNGKKKRNQPAQRSGHEGFRKRRPVKEVKEEWWKKKKKNRDD
ncbi:unnamed protein product [Caenorhabditis auriculariae]|uniref:ATP-dependent RNA helicase n=1 Tax=Caenorhabditis auriculariae TaxID=2777116 RepID=A0A8S1GZ15_9PELO|nr:unnamed protein product [Caenorhabditis auriculariae]